MSPLTATQTLDRARAALQSGRGAGLPELLKLIETLTTNHAEVSLEHLSELIEKDAAVLSRVLGVANTVANNPSFMPLSSVSHAIHQIGFTRVRNLALSLMLVETPARATRPNNAKPPLKPFAPDCWLKVAPRVSAAPTRISPLRARRCGISATSSCPLFPSIITAK